MKKLKVAHVTTIDESLTYLLLDQMLSIRDAGYEVVGISSPGVQVPVLEAAGIRHIAAPMTRRLTPHADLLSLWRLCRAMRRERLAIVHTHTPKAGLLGQLAARMAGVPIVVNTLHGMYLHDRMPPLARRAYILTETVAARCSDLILSQNREDMETAVREGVCPAEKIRYLGNGIDLSRFDPRGVSGERKRRWRQELGLPVAGPVVGFVGRLAGKRKGLFDLLAAARLLRGRLPEVRLLIVGASDKGKPDAVNADTAAEYGVADCCLFVGQRPNHELARMYALMDLLVLPSLFEGVPRVVMEAAAMQVPAVATDVKGNREAVEHGVTGLLVPLGDVEALAGAMVELLADRRRAQRMGREARRRALERFDQRAVFGQVISEYGRLLREKALTAAAAEVAG